MPPRSNSLKRLPWLDPPPKSQTQSSLIVDLKRFHAHTIPDDYPFRLDPDRPTMVPFFEWRGRGAPPKDIGYPGDVYLDLTPDHFALYAYTTTKWVKWVGPRVHKEQLIAHPHFPDDRFLRCSPTTVGWYAIKTITDNRRVPKTLSASEAIRTIIAHERKDPESGQNIQKRKHREHEPEEDFIQTEPRHKKMHGLAGKDQELSADVDRLKKALHHFSEEQRKLESEVQRLRQEQTSNVEASVGGDRDYGSMSFDALCLLARTTDERIAEKVSAATKADRITISNLQRELDFVRKEDKVREMELQSAKDDRDRYKKKLNDFKSAMNAKMHQLDSDSDF